MSIGNEKRIKWTLINNTKKKKIKEQVAASKLRLLTSFRVGINLKKSSFCVSLSLARLLNKSQIPLRGTPLKKKYKKLKKQKKNVLLFFLTRQLLIACWCIYGSINLLITSGSFCRFLDRFDFFFLWSIIHTMLDYEWT